MIRIDHKHMLGERLRRQGLLDPIGHSLDDLAYLNLFKNLQPVAPVHNTRPGDPPKLVHRTAFNDYDLSSRLRESHEIVKGRFCGGRVGYVLQEDLMEYAAVFQKPLSKSKPIYEEILSTLRQSGGLSKEQLKKELSHAPAGEISKALLAMQEAFILYEDQLDTDWDTGWFDFASEWFDITRDGVYEVQAIETVILRFIHVMTFATRDNMKSWSSLPTKTIQQTIASLMEKEKIIPAVIAEIGQGYTTAEDDFGLNPTIFPRGTFMLDKSDFLVRAHMDELKKKYHELEALQYLLIDGEFKGAVLGHWRIGPYDVDDIVLDLDAEQADARKNEILDAIRLIYSPKHHAILKYNGAIV